MYQHLLVPVDGTALSMANVEAAVVLASALGARVTFFHATPDYSAVAGGSLRRRMHPDAFVELAQGQGPAFLAKACAAAAAVGVAHDTCSVVSDRAAEAIVEATRRIGCDLIVMASQGLSGLRTVLSPSRTSQVLRQAHVPLLVTSVQANDPLAQANRACALIQDEHRSLAAVIRGILRLVERAREPGGKGLDRAAFGRMLRYVHDFSEALHHPKEEQSLHRLLRARGEHGRSVIDALEAQHRREYELAAALQAAWDACPPDAPGPDPALARLADALDALATHVWEHMTTEERTLLPLALETLNEADWAAVAKAFEGHRDPGYAELGDDEFEQAFLVIARGLDLPRANTDAERD